MGPNHFLYFFGSNVQVATGVIFANHDITALMFLYMAGNNQYPKRTGQIKVGNNVFIGVNSTILYDVTIGDNVIIGAGSVVNKNILSAVVAAGVPCRVIGDFTEYKKRVIQQGNQ